MDFLSGVTDTLTGTVNKVKGAADNLTGTDAVNKPKPSEPTKDLESGVKTDDEDDDPVTKAVHKIIRREIAEGDARVVYVRKAPAAEEGRCQILVSCLVVILTLLIIIMVIKTIKGI